jgi:hypothetical protein
VQNDFFKVSRVVVAEKDLHSMQEKQKKVAQRLVHQEKLNNSVEEVIKQKLKAVIDQLLNPELHQEAEYILTYKRDEIHQATLSNMGLIAKLES